MHMDVFVGAWIKKGMFFVGPQLVRVLRRSKPAMGLFFGVLEGVRTSEGRFPKEPAMYHVYHGHHGHHRHHRHRRHHRHHHLHHCHYHLYQEYHLLFRTPNHFNIYCQLKWSWCWFDNYMQMDLKGFKDLKAFKRF